MLQKFALAFKTKTIEFFAEEEEEEDDDTGSIRAVDDLVGRAADAVITDQRVVVLRPDPVVAVPEAQNPNSNPNPSPDPDPDPDPETLVSALFATISSFESAYLHFQTAHEPVLPAALCSADAEVVSHLQRLTDLKHLVHGPNFGSEAGSEHIDLSSCLQAQVLDNQNLLRAFDGVINRLQADIDRKDAESAELRLRLSEIELVNDRLAARLDRACTPLPGEENVDNLLSVSVFDSVLRDSCRIMHRFAKSLADLMRRSGWDLLSVAKSIHPDTNYAKAGHCRYTILSHVCLRMFDGFNSYGFGIGSGEPEPDLQVRRNESLRQFIEHSAVDPLELIGSDPNSEFAQFCEKKYTKVIQPGAGCGFLGHFDPSSPLYEPYVSMASSVWALHLLAWAYDPAVEIFQVGRGMEFSIVYMENILRRKVTTLCGKVMTRPKVGFTVIPGFRVGGTVIQCRVYLDPSS